MSKYSEDMESQFKDIRKIKEATKDVINKGGDLALKEFHDSNSIEKLLDNL